MNPKRISLDVKMQIQNLNILQIEQQRMWLNKGKIKYEKQVLEDLKNIQLSVEETSIIKMTMNKDFQLKSSLKEQTFYGDKTLQQTGTKNEFQITCPLSDLQTAKLRVCFGRKNGFGRKQRNGFGRKTFLVLVRLSLLWSNKILLLKVATSL